MFTNVNDEFVDMTFTMPLKDLNLPEYPSNYSIQENVFIDPKMDQKQIIDAYSKKVEELKRNNAKEDELRKEDTEFASYILHEFLCESIGNKIEFEFLNSYLEMPPKPTELVYENFINGPYAAGEFELFPEQNLEALKVIDGQTRELIEYHQDSLPYYSFVPGQKDNYSCWEPNKYKYITNVIRINFNQQYFDSLNAVKYFYSDENGFEYTINDSIDWE